jgi:hypothetical protein
MELLRGVSAANNFVLARSQQLPPRAASGHVAAAPPSSVMKSRRFTANGSRAFDRRIANRGTVKDCCAAGFHNRDASRAVR